MAADEMLNNSIDEQEKQESENKGEGLQVRVIQWGTWRTLSTTFLRCMMGAEGSVTLCEAYGLVWYHGEEKRSKRPFVYEPTLPEDGKTYELVKRKYEAEYPGKRVIFGKEMAFYCSPKEYYKYLPNGYRHSFLIRHPFKAVSSMVRSMSKEKEPGYHTFQPDEVRYEDIWNLYNHARNTIDPTATIIDADDFVRDPEGMLRKYCSIYNIEYCDAMLHWNNQVFNEEMEKWGASWFVDLINSSTVKRQPDVQNLLEHPPDMSHFTAEIRETIEENLVFYKKLYQHRLTTDSDNSA
ncbi:uncharacterized protein LOC142342535 isoform X2 [Convolutriloba macropyga]|uniref:uncharacterized protein LOC142342535 isoform X2 n=1 Tax=Convolutriloba macropyga TaxID=536237 RepID=UPI003F523C4C